MMRNFILWALSIFLICVVALMATKTISKLQSREAARERTEALGELPIFSLDSTKYVLTIGKPVILILFNSECDHCQYEAGQIKKNIASFSMSSIVLISSERLSKIKEFSEKYGLSNQENVTFCKINPSHVFDAFGSGSFPRIFIYSTERKLVKKFDGETKIEAILKYLR